MAEKNQLKRADTVDFGGDDPFAELTSIMGFDPRVPVRPAAAEKAQVEEQAVDTADIADDDFGIDLEKELLGDLSFEEDKSEAIAAAPVTDAADHVDFGDAFDMALSDVHDEADAPAADAAHAADGGDLSTAFASDLDEELSLARHEVAETQDALAEPADDVAVFEADMAAALADDAGNVAADTTAAFETEHAPDELFDDGASVAQDFELEWKAEDFGHADAVGEAAPLVADADSVDLDFDIAMADVDMDFAADTAAMSFDAPAAGSVPEAAVEGSAPSLEDELNALLGNAVPRATLTGGYDAAPFAVDASARSGDALSGQSEFSNDDYAGPSYAVAESTVDDGEEPEMLDHLDIGDGVQAASEGGHDAAPEFGATQEYEVHETEDRGAPAAEDPFETLQRMAAAIDLPRTAAFQVPDIDTVDVPERAIAVDDDLDIPEIAYQDEQVATEDFDAFEADLASAYGDMAQPIAALQGGYFPGLHRDDAREADSAPIDGGDFAAAGAAQGGLTAEQLYADAFGPGLSGDFDAAFASEAPSFEQDAMAEQDYDAGEDDVAEMAPAFAAQQGGARNRGLMIAAIVGGVAVLGGIGAFALSFGNDGDSVPTVIHADSSPIKVRPKNPGGTTVPNQDNKVYETVASGQAPSLPEQKELITSTEEPLDVASGVPGVRIAGAPAETSDPIAEKITPKGEDRLPASTDADLAGTDKTQVAAVAPRRVRTMIVRPDGTLVPREEVEPEAAPIAAEPEAGADAMPIQPADAKAKDTEIGTATLPADVTAPAKTAPVAKVAPASAMPNSVAIAPSRPSDQPVDIVGEVKPDQVASINPSAPAAAGAWSVQIASQPSEEAAKSSYQDLARRYGSVIGGKGVTIVKAEIAGKGTYWRVRIPAGDRNAAINLCESYKSAGGNCFVSK